AILIHAESRNASESRTERRLNMLRLTYPVANAEHRFNVLRVMWVGLDFGAQILDVNINRTLEGGETLPLQAVEQFSTGEDTPRSGDQCRQQFKFGRRQVDADPATDYV